jgi:hypothetical protein
MNAAQQKYGGLEICPDRELVDAEELAQFIGGEARQLKEALAEVTLPPEPAHGRLRSSNDLILQRA